MSDIKTYQWLKGERAGDFVKWDGTIIQDGSVNYLQFADGSLGNEELLNDFFIEVPSENEPFYITEAMEKQYSKDRVDFDMKLNNSHELKQQDSFPEPGNFGGYPKQESAIGKLLKDSKKTKITLTVPIVVDVPPAELMKVLSDSYEDGESQILDYLSNSLNCDIIKHSIASQIWINSFKKKTKSTRINEAI